MFTFVTPAVQISYASSLVPMLALALISLFTAAQCGETTQPRWNNTPLPFVRIRIVLFATLLFFAPYSSASSRVALLVGVSDYNERDDYHSLVGLEELEPLRSILHEKGFSVAILMNPTFSAFERELREFAKKEADLAILFISARGRDQIATRGRGTFGRIFLKDATWKLAAVKSGHYADDWLRREYSAKHVWILIHGCNCEKLRQGDAKRTTRNLTPSVADIVDQASSLAAGTLSRKDGDDGSALAISLTSVLRGAEDLCGDKLFDRLKEDVQDRVFDSVFRFSRGMAKGACI